MVAARQACFQDGENERNISTALVEYDADDIYAINTQTRP